MREYILVFDQSTTSTSAFAFSLDGEVIASHGCAFPQYFPNNGWVEHDGEEIWQTALDACRGLLSMPALMDGRCLAVGVTNQRETSIIWDRATGKPISKAIVWQDRRTADVCEMLKAAGHEAMVQAKTGLLLDPYFSATKIAWMLDNVVGARARAERGELAFGTMESFLIWRLTGGAHFSDATNASRTSLLNIHTGQWDDDLLSLFNVPKTILPEVVDNAFDFGRVDKKLFGVDARICGAIGDQQAASFGQKCTQFGDMKSTYGTGCFALVNTGDKVIVSENKLLSTIAYRLGGTKTYALEGSIFMAGAIVQWMRDNMLLFKNAHDSETLASEANPDSQVIMVPAFTGLGAPYWDVDARGTLLGMTRDTGVAEIVRAGLESVSLQTSDLVQAINADMHFEMTRLRIDGGMAANNWLAQNLSDLTGLQIERGQVLETTALGAAYMAMLGAGIISDVGALGAVGGQVDVFGPLMEKSERLEKQKKWSLAVQKVCELSAIA